MPKKSKLSLENAPITKRQVTPQKKGLGLKTKEHIWRTYRFRPDTVEALEDIVIEANKRTKIKLYATTIVELLIKKAAEEDIEELIDYINGRIN